MMRGITPPISARRRAGLEAPMVVTIIRWDGLVPEAHRGAFAHKLVAPGGKPLVGRWYDDTFLAAAGYWWIEGREGGHHPGPLSRDGWGYAGPLRDDPLVVQPAALPPESTDA